jgi:glutamate racemase
MFTGAELAVQRGAEAIVVPCNTATVTAIDALRERFEPRVPVIGTVPAVKSAAATVPDPVAHLLICWSGA